MNEPVGYQPPFYSTSLLESIPLETVVPVLFTLVFIVWAIYTIVVAYHWIRYGHQSWMAVPALLLHLIVSGWLMVFATSGLH